MDLTDLVMYGIAFSVAMRFGSSILSTIVTLFTRRKRRRALGEGIGLSYRSMKGGSRSISSKRQWGNPFKPIWEKFIDMFREKV